MMEPSWEQKRAWGQERQHSNDLAEARRDLASHGGGCVLYPLGAIALLGLCCFGVPSILEHSRLPLVHQLGQRIFSDTTIAPPTPLQMVQRYMEATIEGKTQVAKAVTCADPHLDPLTTWWAKIQALPTATPPVIRFNSSAGMIREDNAFVTTVVTVTALDANGAPAEQVSRTFLFNVANEQGWKVSDVTTD